MQNGLELVIGIGDLHGHYPALESLLIALTLKYKIFQNRELRPGVEIVFTGDYIDRGDMNLKTIETMKILKERNSSRVHELFGNHELMALADMETAKMIVHYAEHQMLNAYENQSMHGSNGGTTFVKEFGSSPKKAFEEYINRLSRTGDIGIWMRSLEPLHVTKINGKKILFVHGGVPDELAGPLKIQSYLQAFNAHIEGVTSLAGGPREKFFHDEKVDTHSMFWDRKILSMNEAEVNSHANRLGVDYIVFGHTPHTEIKNLFGRAFDIDVGMTPAYGANEPAAIVFKPGEVIGFYVHQGEVRLA